MHSYGGYTTNLPLEDLLGGKAWVAVRASTARPLDPEHGGPARLLVPHLYFWKSAKWVSAHRAERRRRARLLGVLRLPRLRGPVAGTALRRRLSWLTRRGRRPGPDETAEVSQHRARRAGLGRPPPRPARRRAPDGRGRLPGPAQLLDRHAGRRRAAHHHGRAPRGRRGIALSGRASCGPATRSSCADRSGATSCGSRIPGGPLLLVAGGSGVVPLMAMLRRRAVRRERRSGAAAALLALRGRR